MVRVLAVLLALFTGGSIVGPGFSPGNFVVSAQQPPKQAPDEFVPIDQLPPDEELPAAPMVVAAYVFVWVAFLGYVFLLVKRVRKVERDLQALEQKQR